MKVRFTVTKVTDLKHGPNWVLCNVKGQDDNGTRYSVVRWGKAAEQAAVAFPIDSTVELLVTKGELVENKWSWEGSDYSELQLSRGSQARLVRVSDAAPAVSANMTEVIERLDKLEARLARIENALLTQVKTEPEPEPPKAKAPAKKRTARKSKAAAKKTTKANDEIEAVDTSAIPF